jgi:hypothetical protein
VCVFQIPLLLIHAIHVLGCTPFSDTELEMPTFCKAETVVIVGMTILTCVNLIAAILFCYLRLYQIAKGTTQHIFWIWYKYIASSLLIIAFICLAVGSISGNYQLMFDHNTKSPNTLVSILRFAFYSSVLVWISLALFGILFCFSKIILKVWSSSIKITKLLRSEDRQLVFIFRRKVYAYLIIIALSATLAMLDILFLQILFLYALTSVGFQLCLSFLEFVRQGVEKLDDYEIQEYESESVPIDEGVGMEMIEPLSRSELSGEK